MIPTGQLPDRGRHGTPTGQKPKNKTVDATLLAKPKIYLKNQLITDMIRTLKLISCGGISRILFCPMTLGLDGEVAWSGLDHYI